MKKIYYLRAVNFLSAFLLFQIELIISKIFLPKFGGSYLVWGACIVFFQAILFLGYVYAHVVIARFGIFRYRFVHILLFFLPLLGFPGKALPAVILHQDIPMVLDVFWQLVISIGLVFFVLSTTAVITQSWLSASKLPQHTFPYQLYAVSNLGSFAALVSYPFCFELFLGIKEQLMIWRSGYILLFILHVILWQAVKVKYQPARRMKTRLVAGRAKVRWLLLAAGSVIAFLAVTNIITHTIVPAPLLWVIPLCIYLLSYVLNFKSRPWCPKWINGQFHYVTAFCIVFFFLTEKGIIPVLPMVIIYYVLLFAICMLCQNQLVRNKPHNTEDLTAFYVYIALGGFLGGLIASWAVPVLSTLMIEFFLSLVVIHAALILGKKEPVSFHALRLTSYAIAMLAYWPMLFKNFSWFGLIFLILIFGLIFKELAEERRSIFVSVVLVFLITPFVHRLWLIDRPAYVVRNYYGIYRVARGKYMMRLFNGTVVHGGQLFGEANENIPIIYYNPSSPVGKLLNSDAFRFKKIGIVGLGVGALAAYGRDGQTMDFFELDQVIEHIADDQFTFLKNSAARINHFTGDARVQLEQRPDDHYDLIIIDAFSGDAVPVHLLTTEAITEYTRKLTDQGLLLFHVSNQYLRLERVLESNARALDLYFTFSKVGFIKKEIGLESVWCGITKNKDVHGLLVSELDWKEGIPDKRGKYLRPWTDSYSSILRILLPSALIHPANVN